MYNNICNLNLNLQSWINSLIIITLDIPKQLVDFKNDLSIYCKQTPDIVPLYKEIV
jgi:hypothetical protein